MRREKQGVRCKGNKKFNFVAKLPLRSLWPDQLKRNTTRKNNGKGHPITDRISGHLTNHNKTFAKHYNHKGPSYFFPPISGRVHFNVGT
jgi:hypothetical protein